MDGTRRLMRFPIFFTVIAVLFLAAAIGGYIASSPNVDRDIAYDLLDHSGNPNDAKDNCPHDGNAGKGNDNKGPNGGCRPPKGEYGRVNN